jgi:hypothetical protein
MQIFRLGGNYSTEKDEADADAKIRQETGSQRRTTLV